MQTGLTDSEGTFLSLVLRCQPITTYEVAKIYAASPVSSFNTSPGKLYPLVRRLRERGLIAAEPAPDDARGTERLSCTEAGRSQVRAWVLDMRPAHLLLEDPLRTKISALNLLSADERLRWAAAALAALNAKLEEIEDYARATETPYGDLVRQNAVLSLSARMEWLNDVIIALAQEKQP